AGAGKTMLAIQLARKLAARGGRTLLTCVNERLAAYLQASVGAVRGIDVDDIRGLCARMAAEAGLSKARQPEVTSARDVPPDHDLAVMLAAAADVLGPRYEAMVVDEAQNFRPEWWPPLFRLHRH